MNIFHYSYMYQCIYFSLSPVATSLNCGDSFLANRVALLERDYCIAYPEPSKARYIMVLNHKHGEG